MLSAMRGRQARDVVMSYDIACQICRNFRTRLERYPKELQIDPDIITWVIPKFHANAHGFSCRWLFSLNFLRWMARMDGENIERGWAWLNSASLSTREMGPGARQDALDDQWSFWNWRIVVSLGVLQ